VSREVELPDGTILEFPEGTPDDVMLRAARKQLGVQAPKATPAPAPTLNKQQVGGINSALADAFSGAGAMTGAVTQKLGVKGQPAPQQSLRAAAESGGMIPLPPARPTAPRVPSQPLREVAEAGTNPRNIAPALKRDFPALARAAPRGVGPAAAGAYGFGVGAAATPFQHPIAKAAGGLLGAFGAAVIASSGQEQALDALPEGITVPLGQDAATRAQDRAEHPYATMIGESLPGFMFGAPGAGVRAPATNNALRRAITTPAGQAALGGGIGGSIELGREVAVDGQVDPGRVAIAAGMGALQTKNTRLGDKFMGAGDWTAGLFGARRAAFDSMAGDFEARHPDGSADFNVEPPPFPEGGFKEYTAPDGSAILSADGETPIRFRNHKQAARYAVDNELAGSHDIAISEDGIVLRRRGDEAPAAPVPDGNPETTPVSGQPPIVRPEPTGAEGAPVAPVETPPPAAPDLPPVEPVAGASTVQAGIEAVAPRNGDVRTAEVTPYSADKKARPTPIETQVETVLPAEDTVVGYNGYEDPIYISKNGELYTIRRDDPRGTPRFGGMLRVETLPDGSPAPDDFDPLAGRADNPTEGIAYDTEGTSGGYAPGDRRAAQAPREEGVFGEGREQQVPVQGEEGGDGLVLDRADRSGISGPEKGGYTPQFVEASYTNRPSAYESAVRASGIEPDKFKLLPPNRQSRILADAVKTLTGIEVTVGKDMNIRLANDQMLDAHQTLQGMASVLGVDPKAFSLGGKLKLNLINKSGKVKFLGAFDPQGQNIILPGRSNSFAHEWSHALDWHLLSVAKAQGRGLSGMVRKDGATFEPRDLRDAFIDLLNTMFFNDAEMAAKIMDLERRIAATKSANVRASLQSQIDNYKAGRSQSGDARSAFYRGAKEFGLKTGSDGYWTSPTEMMARAFEAYVSARAAARGLGTEFIGKGDTAYQSTAEDRFKLTFPHNEEREAIFRAFDNVMAKLTDSDVLPAGSKEAPEEARATRAEDFDRHVEEEKTGSAIERELAEAKRDIWQMVRRKQGRAKSGKTGLQRAEDIVATMFYNMGPKLRMIEARYKSEAVREIADKLDWTPGSGKYVGETLVEEVDHWRGKNYNRLANILKKNGLMDMREDGEVMLRQALTSQNVDTLPPEYIKAAAEIRTLLDAEFYRNTNAGIDIGYIRDGGYLKRMMDTPRVLADTAKFVEKATEVYKIVFDRDVGKDAEAVMAREDGAAEFAKIAKLVQMPMPRGFGKMDEGDQLALIESMFDAVRDAYALNRANAWLARMTMSPDYDFDMHSPDGSYTKSRTLPIEADEILADFYVQNPIEALLTYFDQSARRVAYARRFGAQNEKLNALKKGMAKDKVLLEDQNEVLKIVNLATGRGDVSLGRSQQMAVSFIHTYTTLRLLPRAIISSLVEPVTAAITASDWKAGINGLVATLVGTKSLNGKQRHELARAMGIVSDMGADALNDARFGGSYADDPRMARLVQRMFENTGLTQLTRRQRTQTLAPAHAFLDNLAGKAVEGDLDAKAMLSELGITDPKVWSKEMLERGRMPDVEDLQTKWGEEYALAVSRFIDLTIQNSNPMTRPQLASHPVARIMYGITGFSTTAWRNIMKRRILMTKNSYQRARAGGAGKAKATGGAAGAAAGFVPGAIALYLFVSVISVLREYLLNRQRWDDLEKKGELETTQAMIALSRTFSLGIADPAVQAYSGLKYQRDLSNVMVGPGIGAMLQGAQAILGETVRDSKKTNTAEFNRTRAIYDNAIGPAISFAASYAPGGPWMRAAYGLTAATATSPRAGTEFATAIEGPKGSKTDPVTGKVIGPPPKKKQKAGN